MGVKSLIPLDFEPTPLPGSVTVPDLVRVLQDQNHWCWAACTIMVLNRYDISGHTQCELASSLFDPQNKSCCDHPASTKCNQGCDTDKIETVYSGFKIDCQQEPIPDGPSTVFIDHLLSTIRAEIDAKRPVELRYVMDINSSHAVLLTGYVPTSDGGFRYMVTDPLHTGGCMTGDALATLDGRGNWANIWTGIKPQTFLPHGNI